MKFIYKGLKKIISLFYPAILHARYSFSQEGEDLLLDAFFENYPQDYRGFYVDIGAHHPFRFSNTYHFYSKGWQGINVDATPGSMNNFKRYRKRDINIEMGVGNEDKSLTFYCFNEPALNTFDEALARQREGKYNYSISKTQTVQVRSLKTILDDYLPQGTKIDFITIDVEGLDLEVLLSNDWQKYRPNLILVESINNEVETDKIENHLKAEKYLRVGGGQRTKIFIDQVFHGKA